MDDLAAQILSHIKAKPYGGLYDDEEATTDDEDAHGDTPTHPPCRILSAKPCRLGAKLAAPARCTQHRGRSS